MNKLPPIAEQLERAFRPGPRGVVGVVDDLLDLCREDSLHLEWQADRCRIRRLKTEPTEWNTPGEQRLAFRPLTDGTNGETGVVASGATLHDASAK